MKPFLKHTKKIVGLTLFTRELMTRPRQVGAAIPSSKALARSMAEQVPLEGDGLVVELGAGTGVVTDALLARGIHHSQIIVIERSPAMVKYLRKVFPQLTIIEGDAADLSELIPDAPIKAIVSSLPLRSLPASVVNAFSKQLDLLLKKGGLFIQFTYCKGTGHQALHLHKIFNKHIWLNFPPARVEVYRCE